jgi:hypothetical protein
MTQRVSQSKREFAPCLIFFSMAPKKSRAEIQGAPALRPHAFHVLRPPNPVFVPDRNRDFVS